MKKASQKQKLRPTSNLVRMALFNMLGDIEGLLFFDLFSGTGQVGLMAEDRGAEVIFVEQNPKLSKKIREKARGKIITGDVLDFLASSNTRADIIFADPPYSYEYYDKLIEFALRNLKKDGIFILEHSKKLTFPCDKRKVYGDTALSIWRKEYEEGRISGDL